MAPYDKCRLGRLWSEFHTCDRDFADCKYLRSKGHLMSNADKPWSGSTAASSNSDSGSSPVLTSPKMQTSGAAPAAGDSSVDDARAFFNRMCRELDEREKASGQQAEQSAAPAVPASLLESKPMTPNGDHPHDDYGARANEMIALNNAAFNERDRELMQKHQEEEGALKGGRLGEMYQTWGQQDAEARAKGAAEDAGKARESAAFRSGAGQHHAEEQRGWAEYDRTETAGERQHETEERSRSGGMSL